MLQFFDLFDHPGHRRIAATFDGKADSRVSAVYDAQPRHSFIVAMKGIAKLWEIGYGAGDAAASGGLVEPRRTQLDAPLDDFVFDPGYAHVIGTTRSDGSPAPAAHRFKCSPSSPASPERATGPSPRGLKCLDFATEP